jgi:multicomponent Na+:H+ antiporter subunit D
MSALPLSVAIPLLTAALLVASGHALPRRAQNGLAILAAAAMTVCVLIVLHESAGATVVYWFGGWHADGGVALGVAFTADPLGAGMAALASVLVLLVLVYSWSYMDESHAFDVLVLTFGAAMVGFSLTGDIFNMFVWFELMGVSAYALAGFKIEELGPLQGAVNFAVTNTIGAYMMLSGIALLYARTGALNLAQIGRDLAGHKPDRLVVVAFVLLVAGLMVKAAIVPFHFWLADAHAASPAPVCALLSGAMVELGIFFVARVYWTAFSGPFGGHPGAVKGVLVGLGVATALLGALMCFLQRHLKRLLAYSTISHSGLMLTGVALLDPRSLSGAAALILSHGLLKAGLFLVCGIVLLELRNIDELRLHAAGRGHRLLAALWFAGTLGLVGVPYVGVFLGHELLDQGARGHGYGWLAPVAMVAAGVSAGAMLRAGARIFLGWGASDDDVLTPEPGESPPARTVATSPLIVVSAVAIVLGLVVTLVPGLGPQTELGAQRFVERGAYSLRVLHDVEQSTRTHSRLSLTPVDEASALYGLGALAVALGVAALGLWHERLPRAIRSAGAQALGRPTAVLRAAHSGIIGDYLLWLAAGTLLIGAVCARG